MAPERVGFMGAVLSTGDPRAAWEAYRSILDEDESQRDAVLRLAETEEGRAMLDASRDAWRGRGFEAAPFEAAFEEGRRAGRGEER